MSQEVKLYALVSPNGEIESTFIHKKEAIDYQEYHRDVDSVSECKLVELRGEY